MSGLVPVGGCVCRRSVRVATSSPTELIKRFSLASGHRSERGALATRYLTGIRRMANQEMWSVLVLVGHAVLPGHTVRVEGYQASL